jgi:parallel beta-helix repeat protein
MRFPHQALVLGIACIVVVSGFTVSSSQAAAPLDPRVLYVGGSGPGNYTRIQDAANASADGDTVFVYDDSSPYQESVQIYTSITVLGESRSTTVVEGGSRAFSVYADSVRISGFTITDVGDFWQCAGVYAISRYDRFDNLTIEDNLRMSGVFLDHASWCVIRDCLIQNNNYHGLRIEYSSSNLIENNTIRNVHGHGIYLANSPENVVIGNTVQEVFTAGIVLSQDATGNTVVHNNLIDNPQQAYDEGGGNTWNLSSGGNFYSDYTGQDNNSDGFGDTPYIIPGNFSQDNLPLMHPYGLVTPLYQVSLQGGVGLSLRVRNIGPVAGRNITWTLTLSGGLRLYPLRHLRSGVIASLSPDEETVVQAVPLLLGFGSMNVMGMVGDHVYTGSGLLVIVYFVLRR